MPVIQTLSILSALTDYNKLPKLLSMQDILKRAVSIFFDLIESVVVALSIFVVIYLFLVQPHQVKGASMDPTFHDGQYILTDKISYRFNLPQRGDVVVFKAPMNPDFDYIKRIIGLPGDTITIQEGQVVINEQPLSDEYIQSDTVLLPGQYIREGEQMTVGSDEFFVLGDNRSHSADSRQWGMVPKKDIIGKVFFRYWPVNKFGIVSKPEEFN